MVVPHLRSAAIGYTFACLLITTSSPASTEKLHDVWQHDQSVTTVSKEIPHWSSANSARRSDGPSPRVDNKTIVKSQKLIDVGAPESSQDEVCDFGGRHLRVAVSPQPPFVSCLQDVYGDWLCNGSNIEVIHVLERRLNFQADWVVLANGNHDEDLTTRNPVSHSRRAGRDARDKAQKGSGATQTPGVLSLVSTGRALMSANGFMQTLDRLGHNLVLSEPFDSFKLHFLLSKSVHDHDHIFIKPFDSQAWFAILTSGALIVPVLYFINSTSLHYAIQDDKPLRKLPLWLCLKWRARRAITNAFKQDRRSSLVSNALEKELRRVFQVEASLRAQSLENPTASSLRVPVMRSPLPFRGESKRRQRLAKRQWAYERRRAIKLGRRNRKSGFFKLVYVIWYVVASLANQGGETEDLPHANSTRILVAFWWLYLIVICAIHSGILTAILTFPKQSDFIQTFDDYLSLEPRERNSLQLAVDKYGELAHLLANTDNLHKSPLQLLQKQSVPVNYVNFQRHRQRILDDIQVGKSALMEEKSTISHIITREYFDSQQTRCLFKSSRHPIDVIPMLFILNKNMTPTCLQSINRTLRRIMKTGLAQKWRRNYEAQGNDCLNTVVINAGDVDKIELKHVMLAIWLLILGTFIGLLCLIGEIVWIFTIENEQDDDDDDDNDSLDSISTDDLITSSSSSTSSGASTDGSDHMRLGFRRALMPSSQQLSSIRSLRAKRMPVRKVLRTTRRQQKRARSSGPIPKITFSASVFDDDEAEDERRESEERGTNQQEDGRHSVRPSKISSVVLDEREGFKEVRELHLRRIKERRNRRLAREAERRAKRIQKTVDLLRRLHGGKIYSSKLKSRVRRMSHSMISHLKFNPLNHVLPTPGSYVIPGNKLAVSGGQEQTAVMRRRRRLSVVKVSPM